MAEKVYTWLKLQHDFFKNKEMKKLRKIAGGETFTIIYLKLQLLSLCTDGSLFYDQIEPTFADEIALEIDENVENVNVTLSYLRNVLLLQDVSEYEFLLPEVIRNIGTETSVAERVRRHRERKLEMLDRKKNVQQALHCNVDETKCNTEIEIEKEIDKYIVSQASTVCNFLPQKKDDGKKKKDDAERRDAAKRVLEFLNKKCGTRFLPVDSTLKMIEMRIKEGINEEMLRCIVVMKFRDWGKDENYFKYLRPSTLFNKEKCHNYFGLLNHDEK